MDIFNHLAYNTTGEEIDKTFSRCEYCRSYPHACQFHVMLARVNKEEFIHAAWCIDKPIEEEDDDDEDDDDE